MTQQTGRVEGKKGLITGAGQGLGAASAHLLARHGAKVALADINHAGVEAVAARINAEFGANTADAFRLDVRDETQWIDVLASADSAMGGLSVLVNNAGIIGPGNIEEFSFADWKRTQEINVDSLFLSVKYGVEILVQNETA